MENDPKPYQSSAQILSDQLAKQGIAPADASAKHLTDLYPTLRALPGRANFKQAEPLLDNLPTGGSWGVQDFAVIVETRNVPQLAYVIKNITEQTSLPVHLFHGKQNQSILETPYITHLRQAGKLIATCLVDVNLSAPIYNAMFLDTRFYKALAGRGKFLVFQTDSLCCENSPLTLEDFIAFDYTGAFWNTKRPVGLNIYGGFGGFSLRNHAACCKMIERFSPELWPGGEDGYFAFHLDLTGHKVADPQAMAQFATQSAFQFESFGAHKVRDLPPQDHAKFLKYCPEIRNVIAWNRE